MKSLLKIISFSLIVSVLVLGCIHKPDDPFNDRVPNAPNIEYRYADDSKSKIEISWKHINLYMDGTPLTEKSYIVYKKVDGKVLEFETEDNFFNDTLEVNKYHEYKVICKDKNNKKSKQSNIINIGDKIINVSPKNSELIDYQSLQIEFPENTFDSSTTIELETVDNSKEVEENQIDYISNLKLSISSSKFNKKVKLLVPKDKISGYKEKALVIKDSSFYHVYYLTNEINNNYVIEIDLNKYNISNLNTSIKSSIGSSAFIISLGIVAIKEVPKGFFL